MYVCMYVCMKIIHLKVTKNQTEENWDIDEDEDEASLSSDSFPVDDGYSY